jgi:site-specific DNA recombinase
MDTPAQIKYCLYARKSSESDERQTMSIDSQIKEMMAMAEREGLQVVDTKHESFSAKQSSCRPVFNELLADIRSDKFDGILTWAPDRLSRNAGDLGSLVDLMDADKLHHIRTFGQSFSNTPNEKFLLMILCSQAKLENDNRGVNVKRGIRAKCEMGWRPCLPPIGYYNRAMAGVRDIVVDNDRASYVKEMFVRAANGDSGQDLKVWLDSTPFRTRAGAFITKSQIYVMLKNPFFYGEFQYPKKSGKWYKGNHEPLISRQLFDEVQKQLYAPQRSKWGEKYFAFKGLIKCRDCGASIVGEEKFKQRKDGGRNRHIYYHCSRQVEYYCTQPYLREADLVNQVLGIIKNLKFEELRFGSKLKYKMHEYDLMTKEHIGRTRTNEEIFYTYADYLMRLGDNKEKAEFLRALNLPLVLHDRRIHYSPDEYHDSKELNSLS